MHFCLAYSRRGSKLTTNLQLRTDVMNEWAYSFAAPYAFMACVGTILPSHTLHFTAGFLVQFHDGCWLRIRHIELSFPCLLITSIKYRIYNHNNTNAKKQDIQHKFELLPPWPLHIFEVPFSISSIKYKEIQNKKNNESCINNDFKSWLLQYSSVWHCSTFRNFMVC